MTKIKSIKEYDTNTIIDNIETIVFGSYPQIDASKNPIEWIVLDVLSDKALLLSKHILDCMPYNSQFEEITWEQSSLRKWLNEDFYDIAFDDNNKKLIIKSNVKNDKEYFGGVKGGDDTVDKVFLLSIEEVKKYFGDNNKLDKRLAAYGTQFAKNIDFNGRKLYIPMDDNENEWYKNNSKYWLRTPGSHQTNVAGIFFDGHISEDIGSANDKTIGVRPAIWLKL